MVEKYILWLEVAINDIKGMQVIQGKCDFCGIKFGHRIREALTGRYRNGPKGG